MLVSCPRKAAGCVVIGSGTQLQAAKSSVTIEQAIATNTLIIRLSFQKWILFL
jgi:hypothetical protein